MLAGNNVHGAAALREPDRALIGMQSSHRQAVIYSEHTEAKLKAEACFAALHSPA